MYTIIAATNRQGSNSFKVGKLYKSLFELKGIDAQLFNLENLDLNSRSASVLTFEKNVLIPTQKFIIIVPEYNGSYPGTFKSLIDNSNIKECWYNKKALLTGVATGRGGNIRGMEHLTGSLNYLHVFVHPNRLPISLVHEQMDDEGRIINASTIEAMELQITEFIKY